MRNKAVIDRDENYRPAGTGIGQFWPGPGLLFWPKIRWQYSVDDARNFCEGNVSEDELELDDSADDSDSSN